MLIIFLCSRLWSLTSNCVKHLWFIKLLFFRMPVLMVAFLCVCKCSYNVWMFNCIFSTNLIDCLPISGQCCRFQQYVNCELPDVQAGLEKAEEPELKLPTSTELSKKQESSRKKSISALLIMPKPLTVWITIKCGKFWKRWEYQTAWPASWETYMQVRK